MNKASVHVTQPGNTNRLGDLLSAGVSSGNIIPVLYAVNANLKTDILQRSPTTKLIYRRQSNVFARLPNDMWTGDPVQSATNWLTLLRDPADQNRTLIQNWALNPADYYDPLNEPAIDLPPNPTDAQLQDAIRKAQWLNTWMITALDIANAHGMKLALFSFNTGGCAMQVWSYLFPALRKAKAFGGILSLHEYSLSGTLQNPQPGNVLRHREVWAILPTDCRIPIVITECGAGNGYDTSVAGQAWVNDLMWYNTQVCSDAAVLGFCAFQLGGSESNMVDAMPSYITAVQNFSCLPHVQRVESENGSTIPADPDLVDKDLSVWTLGDSVPMGRVILKNGIQFQGGQGDLLLYWNRQIYTHNARNEWYVAGLSWTRVPGDPRRIVVEGIDVSHYQGTISWSQIQKSFTFIKATEGNTIIDSAFSANWSNAKYYGIPRGAYHFYRFVNSPAEQAALFIGALNKDYGELPLVVDVEDEVTPANFNDLKTFVDTVQNTTKRRVMIYTAEWWRSKYNLTFPTWMTALDLWVASYTSSPILPRGYTTYRFWQYSSSGIVNGIVGNVDLDKFNGTPADFQAYLTTINYTPPASVGLVAIRSVNGRADGGQLRVIDMQGAKTSPLINGYKLYKNAKEDYASMVANGIPISNVLVRLEHVKDRRVAADFYLNASNTGIWDLPLSEAYTAGVRWFEPFNEVNLGVEGNGVAWTSMADFCALYKQVISLARAKFPQAKFLSSALAPAPDTAAWWSAFQTYGVFAASDGYAAHAYWDGINRTYPMDSASGGRHYRGLFPYLVPGKKVHITEAANNMALDSDADKGRQYAQYVKTMEIDKVARVDFFCISSSNVGDGAGFNSSRQTWVRPISGVETISDIPKTMI